jgi:hypothetical protein
MFSLILLLGSAFIFENPVLGNYSATADYGYYVISYTIEEANGIESRAINGAYGFGLGVHGTYLNRSPWRHSVTYREYEASNYIIKMMNVGLDITTTVPQAPIQLAVGAELGTGVFHSQNYKYLEPQETTGGQIHTELSHYFVVQEHVAYFFFKPSFRFYEFALSGQQGHPNHEINGTVPALTAGVGLEF